MGQDLCPAIEAARGGYDRRLLGAIDWCIKVDERERPQDVGALRALWEGAGPVPVPEDPEDSEGEQGKAQSKAQSKTDEQLNYAGFWKRFAAAFIDLLIVAILLQTLDQAALVGDAYDHLWFPVYWIYHAAFESSSKQATPGKMVLGIKVTDLNGRPIGFAKATGRCFGKIVLFILCFGSTTLFFIAFTEKKQDLTVSVSDLIVYSIFSIGYFLMAFTDQKQVLHDRMAGCLVVNK